MRCTQRRYIGSRPEFKDTALLFLEMRVVLTWERIETSVDISGGCSVALTEACVNNYTIEVCSAQLPWSLH